MSSISIEMSDTLCRLASGGGYATRALFTDRDETIIDVTRPILLTSIPPVVNRVDLLERSLVVPLAEISGEKRKTEDDLFRRFEDAKPRILGALYDAVSTALRYVKSTQLTSLPRMADAAKWITAASTQGGGQKFTFLVAEEENRKEACRTNVEMSLAGTAILKYFDHRSEPLEGTAHDLLDVLSSVVPDIASNYDWPSSSTEFGKEISRVKPLLAKVGIKVERSRLGNSQGTRMIRIERS